MPVTLTLCTDPAGHLRAALDGGELAATPLETLPPLVHLQVDAYHLGRALTAALGGDALLNHLS